MASPAPLLRPPIPGAPRQQSGAKVPRLGLSIPASPHQRPVNSAAAPPMADMQPLPMGRSQAPKLSLATPMGSHSTPQENVQPRRRGPPLVMPGSLGASSAANSSDDSAHSRTNSFGASTGTNAAGSLSTNSSISQLNFQDLISGRNDPGSAAASVSSAHSGGEAMARDGSMQGLEVDFAKLELEKGHSLDVQDLDDLGWKAAKREGKIIELGSLGEGAGGAVTRCKLEGGRTVFALKVRMTVLTSQNDCMLISRTSRSSQQTQTRT